MKSRAMIALVSALSLMAGLAVAAAGYADEPPRHPSEIDTTRVHGMMDMMSSMMSMKQMGGMMAGCAGMMRMSDQHQGAPNQQWRLDRQEQPESL